MKILVLGATGMLGHVACRVLGRQHEVVALSRSPVSESVRAEILPPPGVWIEGVDALDLEEVDQHLARHRPDAVINCIGIVKQLEEAHDPVLSIEVNSLFPHRLARLCDRHGARLVHLSTDCVFSGRRGPSSEEDIPDPVDLYGRSKLLGEVNRAPHLTLRTSIIGFQLRGQTSLVEWFLSQRGGEVKGFRKAIYSGVTTYELARIIGELLAEHPEVTGLYQVASEPIDKFDLLTRINDILELGITIHPDDEFTCDRSLDGSRFTRESGIEVAGWMPMLEELKQERELHESWARSERQAV